MQYVPRCFDAQVDARLEALAETGGMLLLTGDSAAGKSRALFEGMVRNFRDRSVCKPDPDVDLSFLHSSSGSDHEKVVWLDDLHNYLRSDGLTPSLLDRLVRRGTVVLATLRTEFHEHYTDEEDGPSLSRGTGPRLPSSPGRVIRAAHHITLDRIWTDDERRAASSREDPRIVAALNADRAHGVAEYLAAGPQVLKRWKAASRVKGNPGVPLSSQPPSPSPGQVWTLRWRRSPWNASTRTSSTRRAARPCGRKAWRKPGTGRPGSCWA